MGSRLALMEEDGDEIAPPSKIQDIEVENNEKVMLIDVYMPDYRIEEV